MAGSHRVVSIHPPAAVAVEAAAPSAAHVTAVLGGPRSAATPVPRVTTRREHGTDGLMGRLPFGLPDDMPIVRVVERHDRFVTDDVVQTWLVSSQDGPTPPLRVRVLGRSSNAYVL